MPESQSIDPRIAESFTKQGIMNTLGARLLHAHQGKAVIEVHNSPEVSQQHGFIHAGVLATVADSACGYAAMSLLPPDRGVLSIEFKVSLLEPALGDRFHAKARVIKSGRKIQFVEAEIINPDGDQEQLIARMSATISAVDQSRMSNR